MSTTRVIGLLAGLLFALSANAGETYRFSSGVVSVGDTIAVLIAKAGKPDREVKLENRLGGAVGERWEYYVGDKLVAFYIHGGRIESIDEQS